VVGPCDDRRHVGGFTAELTADELRAADASLTPSVMDALSGAAVAARSLTGGRPRSRAPEAARWSRADRLGFEFSRRAGSKRPTRQLLDHAPFGDGAGSTGCGGRRGGLRSALVQVRSAAPGQAPRPPPTTRGDGRLCARAIGRRIVEQFSTGQQPRCRAYRAGHRRQIDQQHALPGCPYGTIGR